MNTSPAVVEEVLVDTPGGAKIPLKALARLSDEDLSVWGHSRSQICDELDAIDLEGKPAARARLTRYALERKLLVSVRRRIPPGNSLGGLVRRVRDVCDVLLR